LLQFCNGALFYRNTNSLIVRGYSDAEVTTVHLLTSKAQTESGDTHEKDNFGDAGVDLNVGGPSR